jgi:hypothetical protein
VTIKNNRRPLHHRLLHRDGLRQTGRRKNNGATSRNRGKIQHRYGLFVRLLDFAERTLAGAKASIRGDLAGDENPTVE